jgi:hypothetical protein
MDAYLLENLLKLKLSLCWHFPWSDSSGSMEWALCWFPDFENGWLEYILSTGIVLGPTCPWHLRLIIRSCTHNSFISPNLQEMPLDQQGQKKVSYHAIILFSTRTGRVFAARIFPLLILLTYNKTTQIHYSLHQWTTVTDSTNISSRSILHIGISQHFPW